MKTIEGGRANGIRPYNLFPEIGREAESGLPYVFLAPRTANGRPYRVSGRHGRTMCAPTNTSANGGHNN